MTSTLTIQVSMNTMCPSPCIYVYVMKMDKIGTSDIEAVMIM